MVRVLNSGFELESWLVSGFSVGVRRRVRFRFRVRARIGVGVSG